MKRSQYEKLVKLVKPDVEALLDLLEAHGDSDTSWTAPGRGRNPNSAIVDEYVSSAGPPITGTCTQSPDLAERSQKKLLTHCNFDLHYGRFSLRCWEGMLFVTEGQLDHIPPVSQSGDPKQSAISCIEAFSGHCPGAFTWIGRPGQSV